MTEISSKQLHEQTAAMLDRAKSGQRMKVIRNRRPAAWLIPATEEIDPAWGEIMAEVRKARGKDGPTRPNPILAKRKIRRYATRLSARRLGAADEFVVWLG
jgi:antitoxin (DNA-binding transcriptional repressor) of toxin-antitoxin stability system